MSQLVDISEDKQVLDIANCSCSILLEFFQSVYKALAADMREIMPLPVSLRYSEMCPCQ